MSVIQKICNDQKEQPYNLKIQTRGKLCKKRQDIEEFVINFLKEGEKRSAIKDRYYMTYRQHDGRISSEC